MTQEAFDLHKKLRGKIFVGSKISSLKMNDIKLIYTPGVASISKQIFHTPDLKYTLTSKSDNVAIVTDGTRVLGLGNIGPDAALPVMEGKSVLYREYGKLNAFPICLNTTDKNKIIQTIIAIEPVFGAINLEDIESPKVLEIARELEKKLTIPVFHDDGQGTAVVTLAALINSLKIIKKKITKIKVVIAGSGSAGYHITKLLKFAGCKNIIVLDSQGSIYKGRKNNMNKYKNEIAKITNNKQKSNLFSAMKESDVFIGVSGVRNLLKEKMIKNMTKDPIVFALTNPYPEIIPKAAKKGGARIIATGSFEYKNQVNNAIVFPYLMRAILNLKIKKITMKTLFATSLAMAKTVTNDRLDENHIVPEIFNKNLQKNITKSLK